MISRTRLDRIAFLSFQNALRLHHDAIILFKEKSYPSAFFLSILAQEEIGKMHLVNDQSWRSGENEAGLAEIKDEVKKKKYQAELESMEEYVIKALYQHPLKQGHFYRNSPAEELWIPKKGKLRKEYQGIWDGMLEARKQNAVYVGFARRRGKIDTTRLHHPWEITNGMAASHITRVNDYLLVFGLGLRYTSYAYENEEIVSMIKHRRFLKEIAASWMRSGTLAQKEIEKLERALKDPIVSDARF
ncbi:MAG: hypothetical protein AB203_00445 [Parcubacteria bacterium C7867-008]|nr:MAG: hypothetical protein AB203_00445 [Parcubacteria bacterium C7867-008]